MSDTSLGASLTALSRFFVGDGTLEDTLTRVIQLTVEAIPPADLVGITMMVEGRPRTAVFTDEKAPEIDRTQYGTGEGPYLDAFREGKVFTVDSTLEPGRWPAFRQAAAGYGVRSTMSLPLIVNEQGVGAMNLYSNRERAFSEDDQRAGELFAAQAAIVLATSQAYWDAKQLGVRLGDAMKSRSIIEQAKAILMAAQKCDEDAAFQLLVQASQRENVKLREIATRIVDAATGRSGGTTGK